jgi:hypothetical protein
MYGQLDTCSGIADMHITSRRTNNAHKSSAAALSCTGYEPVHYVLPLRLLLLCAGTTGTCFMRRVGRERILGSK